MWWCIKILVFLTIWNIAECTYSHNKRTQDRSHLTIRRPAHNPTTKEYYTRGRQEIVINVLLHIDKVLTSRLMREQTTKQRMKLKKLTQEILKEVERFYRHPTLNMNIRLILMDTKFLKNNTEVVRMDENGSNYLKSYCNWQAGKKRLARKVYYSVLLTGLDLYYVNGRGQQIRSSTGRGYGGGICHIRKSCTLLEWHPRNVGFLLAHEMAHSMGLLHDGPPHNRCNPDGYIMSATYDGQLHPKSWSPCNRQELRNFLASEKGRCLHPENNNRTLV